MHVNDSSVCNAAQVEKVVAAALSKGEEIQSKVGLEAEPTSNRDQGGSLMSVILLFHHLRHQTQPK